LETPNAELRKANPHHQPVRAFGAFLDRGTQRPSCDHVII
jgi:hypothetical protein